MFKLFVWSHWFLREEWLLRFPLRGQRSFQHNLLTIPTLLISLCAATILNSSTDLKHSRYSIKCLVERMETWIGKTSASKFVQKTNSLRLYIGIKQDVNERRLLGWYFKVTNPIDDHLWICIIAHLFDFLKINSE